MDSQKAISSTALPVDKAVMIIGAGTMGIGIAEVAAVAGHRVLLGEALARSVELRPASPRCRQRPSTRFVRWCAWAPPPR